MTNEEDKSKKPSEQPTPPQTNSLTPVDQPTQEEIVTQIKESDDAHTGPNEVLRRHIEMYSKYKPVFTSLAYTIIGAMIVPALLGFVVTQLRPHFELSTIRGSVARGLWMTIPPLFASLILARALQPGSLAERHFGWKPNLCSGLLKTVNIMIWVWLPLRFVYTMLETFDGSVSNEQPTPGQWTDSLGRLLFIAAMVAFAFGLWQTARSMRKWIRRTTDEPVWGDNFRRLMFWFLPLMPASLAIMSVMGYHFTAVEMSWRMLWTVILMIGISMLGGLASRLLLIAQFGIKLRHLKRTDEGVIKSDESIDISDISQQFNRLLRATALVAMVVVGWQIWSEVLPAIAYLDQWEMGWGSLDADGEKISITLRHVLMAIGVGVITVILSRNLPGLLEITLLDRLPLDRGGRYAISFVVRYLVGIIGILLACQIAGFSWNKVQFLAAGLSVGLGFGLQEIFANVVSGIIILIERPIRVGDVVTVNNTTGTVTQMKLRATTILDRDFRELIVPNKKFITEDVMNWTLSTLTSRIAMPVGVAYGSDLELVEKTLMRVAKRHPLVNETPAPQVIFLNFGDSTLNFELRVFIPNRDIQPKVHHELNMAIDEAFRAKDIEIAFPQRDLHIKNISEFPIPTPRSTDSSGPGSSGNPTPASKSGSATDSGSGASAVADLESETSNGDANNNEDQPDDRIRQVLPFPMKQVDGQQDDVVEPFDKRTG
jgi:potassium efflux system protein